MKKVFFRISVVIYSFFSLLMVLPGLAFADSCKNSFLGFPSWAEYLSFVPNPPSGNCVINTADGNPAILIAMAVLDILIRLSGLVAVFFVAYGGIKLAASQDSPDQVAGAKKTILNAVIGLAIALVSSQIIKFIAQQLVSKG
jgi:uncharacterized Tic20 family protein